jgi:hypothetical protein
VVKRTLLGTAVGALALTALGAEAAERATLTGELIDTWCYFSGVMGGPEATVGTAHHTCALWCAAGGIPVGLLTDDGTVYMVLSFVGEDPGASETLLDLQSHEITVEATVYQRDGLNYVTVENVVDDAGITKLTHEDYGVVPPMAIPEE